MIPIQKQKSEHYGQIKPTDPIQEKKELLEEIKHQKDVYSIHIW